MVNVSNYFQQPNAGRDNRLKVEGTVNFEDTDFSAKKLKNVALSNDAQVFSTNSALNITGFNLIEGGTGLANMTLAAPEEGVYCEIRLSSITSGSVVVTTESGVTFDGSNNTATFDTAGDFIRLAYKSSTEWQIVENNSVTLSSV
jgi:hypothetical protein